MRRTGHWAGFLLMVIGIFLLLGNLELIDLSWDRLWPVFPVVFGLFFFFQFVQSRDKGILIPATLFTGVGLFFFMFTCGVVDWSEMGLWWPVFPLILGLGFFFAYLADLQDTGLLLPAALFLTVGGVFLAKNNPLTKGYLKYWPAIIVLVGLLIFLFPPAKGPKNS